MQDWIEKYNRVTNTLSNYGWFVAPVLMGGEFAEIEAICKKIEQSLIPKEDVNASLNKVISPIIFHPNYRAFSVFKAITLKHLNKYSHFIDQATFHYFKKDFLSAISCLVPVVEGILLSHFGWEYSNNIKKPGTKELIDRFCSPPQRTLKPAYREVYSNALKKCLSSWFFANTNDFDFSNSHLNRHYIAHSLGSNNFYSVLECNRMFTIIDLISEVIVHDEFYNYVFIPDSEPILNNRRDYYFQLITGKLTLKKMKESELFFLKENKHYTSSDNEIDFYQIMSDDLNRIINFHKDIDEKFEPKTKKNSFLNNLWKRK